MCLKILIAFLSRRSLIHIYSLSELRFRNQCLKLQVWLGVSSKYKTTRFIEGHSGMFSQDSERIEIKTIDSNKTKNYIIDIFYPVFTFQSAIHLGDMELRSFSNDS